MTTTKTPIAWRDLSHATIYDLVTSKALTFDALTSLTEALYEDKRGGYLCDLMARDEFMAELYYQTANVL